MTEMKLLPKIEKKMNKINPNLIDETPVSNQQTNKYYGDDNNGT